MKEYCLGQYSDANPLPLVFLTCKIEVHIIAEAHPVGTKS